MTEKPILFSGPMVRAILDGRKTQTRRIVKRRGDCSLPTGRHDGMFWFDDGDALDMPCPYGVPGDRLWVRETWAQPDQKVYYKADFLTHVGNIWGAWKPSIHMPRELSRIILEVLNVRVERLQDISAKDAWAEGVAHSPDVNPLHEFEELWDSINANRAPWAGNPWVWVVEFGWLCWMI